MDGLRMVLQRDAQYLLALVDATLRHVAAADPTGAREAASALARRLERRFHFEEAEVYPAVDRLVQDDDFIATARLRREHEVLRQLIGAVAQDLGSDDWPAAAGDLRELDAALHTHLDEERRTLHPLLDNLGISDEGLRAPSG